MASPAEVRACLDAGARPADLVYSNPIKLRSDIVESAALGVRLFVVDSPEETRKVAEAAPGTAVLCRIVTSGSGSDWPLSRKFGCSTVRGRRGAPARRRAGARRRRRLVPRRVPAARPVGWDAPIEASSRIFASLRAAGLRPWLLDLGGGFPAALEGGRRPSRRTAPPSGARCASGSAPAVRARSSSPDGRSSPTRAGW